MRLSLRRGIALSAMAVTDMQSVQARSIAGKPFEEHNVEELDRSMLQQGSDVIKICEKEILRRP